MDDKRVWSALLGSLLPWLAFFLAAGPGPGLVGAPLYFAFVALPSMLAIGAGRTAVTRLVVIAIMTAVAAFAGFEVASIDDAQAGLAVLLVPFVAIPLATVVWVGGAVVARRRATAVEGPPLPARLSDRLAALVVDMVLVSAVSAVAVTVLSQANAEAVAVVLAVVLPTLYLAAFVALAGRTLGQALLRLSVVDAATGGLVPPGRALLRGLVVVVEVTGTGWMLLAPLALAEVVAVASTGRSLTDRLVGSAVVAA